MCGTQHLGYECKSRSSQELFFDADPNITRGAAADVNGVLSLIVMVPSS